MCGHHVSTQRRSLPDRGETFPKPEARGRATSKKLMHLVSAGTQGHRAGVVGAIDGTNTEGQVHHSEEQGLWSCLPGQWGTPYPDSDLPPLRQWAPIPGQWGTPYPDSDLPPLRQWAPIPGQWGPSYPDSVSPTQTVVPLPRQWAPYPDSGPPYPDSGGPPTRTVGPP